MAYDERMVWVAVAVAGLFAGNLSASPSDNIIAQLIGWSVFLVSFTICIVIATLCYRTLNQGDNNGPIYSNPPLLTFTISLFGILITGVFVITTFRVDDSARQIATEAAGEQLAAILPRQVSKGLDEQLPPAIAERLDNVLPEIVERAAEESVANLVPVLFSQAFYDQLNSAVSATVIRFVSAMEAEQGAVPVAAERRGEFSQPVQVPLGGESWLTFTVRTEGTYSIRAESGDGFDPFIFVYELSGAGALRLTRVDDNGGNGFDSRLDMDLNANVVYYIQVQGNNGSAGECTVSVLALGTSSEP